MTIYNLPESERKALWEDWDAVLTMMRDDDTDGLRRAAAELHGLLDLGGPELACAVTGLSPAVLFIMKHVLNHLLSERGETVHPVGETCLACPSVAMCPAYCHWAGRRDDLGRWERFASTYDLSDWSDAPLPEGAELATPPLLPEVEQRRAVLREEVRAAAL